MGNLALSLSIQKRKADDGTWIAEVSVTNSGAGHKVPTGTWSKHVVVGVWADVDGTPLAQVGGDRAYLGNPAPDGTALPAGDWRDPGGFVLGVRARLVDDEGQPVLGKPPPVFWAAWPTKDVIDERLAPGATRKAEVRFAASAKEPTIEVRILHRRGWLPRGMASVPWTVGTNDPAPEVLWKRVRK